MKGKFRILVMLLLCSPATLHPQSKPRVAILYEPSFPSVDGISVTKQQLQNALSGFQPTFLTSEELSQKLRVTNFEVFVSSFGSAFPKQAWKSIEGFLRDGGNWVNLGGTPFSVPVVREGKVWRHEVPQTSYHKKLGVTQSFRVSPGSISAYAANQEVEDADALLGEFEAAEVFEFYFRFTSTKDFPNEDGSAGQRDAVLTTLVWGLRPDGQLVVAPFLQIDRYLGDFAGGRWILANFRGSLSPKGIRFLVEKAAEGAAEFKVHPLYASYKDGETPTLSIQLSQPGKTPQRKISSDCTIEILKNDTTVVEKLLVGLRGDSSLAVGEVHSKVRQNYVPGLYQIRASQEYTTGSSKSRKKLSAISGFWIYDSVLMRSRKPFSTDGTYFVRDGQPYPVTGTTYMASDVARKFLLEPNPSRWDVDFAEMKRARINMVRTGIWTGWKNYMLDVGGANETALRSLDAFILTARKYDIPVIFTFFAFIPETWGGVNAYLDPRSVNAQKQFLQLICHRYDEVDDIIWDLINEPSFCNPQYLWNCRPNYDEFEREAWDRWLGERYPFSSDAERRMQLQEMWRLTEGESVGLPALDEFSDVNIFDHRRPLKVVDYRLFSQDMFRGWIKEMTSAIRSNGNPKQLITVGQDEGGTNDSPNNQFMADLLGFTSLHNWWLNDDLVWDNVMTRVSGVPNLVEETGVMFYEKMDGSPWRTEEEAAQLLERKLAISFGSGGAGFIEWIWNINPYMKSDNEATIGLFRADGTMKPEFDALAKYARFFETNKHLMKGRRGEEVLMVIPHSNMFSARNFASEATKQCVRVMTYHHGIPLTAVSEYRLGRIKDLPKLVVVPSPRILSKECWQRLLELAKQGSTVLITGPVDEDEHWLPKSRLELLGIEAGIGPVTQEEKSIIGHEEIRAAFGNLKMQRLEKSIASDRVSRPHEIPLAKGKIIWFPLPLENADNIEPTAALYKFVLDSAGVKPGFTVERKHPGILILPTFFEEAILYTCISETGEDVPLNIADLTTKKDISVTVPAQKAVLFFLDPKSGKVFSQLD